MTYSYSHRCIPALLLLSAIVLVEAHNTARQQTQASPQHNRRRLLQQNTDSLSAINSFIQQAQGKLTRPLTVVSEPGPKTQPIPRPPGYKPLYYYNPLTGLSNNAQDPPAGRQLQQDTQNQSPPNQFGNQIKVFNKQAASNSGNQQSSQQDTQAIPQGLVFEPAQKPGYRTPKSTQSTTTDTTNVYDFNLPTPSPIDPIMTSADPSPAPTASIFQGIPGLQTFVVSQPTDTQPSAIPPDNYTGASAAYPEKTRYSKVSQDPVKPQPKPVGSGSSIVNLVDPYLTKPIPRTDTTNSVQPAADQPPPENCQVANGGACIQCVPEATRISGKCVIMPPNCRTYDIGVGHCVICNQDFLLNTDNECI